MTANMVGPHPLAHADYVLKPISSDLDLLSVGLFFFAGKSITAQK